MNSIIFADLYIAHYVYIKINVINILASRVAMFFCPVSANICNVCSKSGWQTAHQLGQSMSGHNGQTTTQLNGWRSYGALHIMDTK